MLIQWYGHACFRIQGNQNDATILIDPYDSSLGLKFSKIGADILVLSSDHPHHGFEDAVKRVDDRTPFVVRNPGEYEMKGVFVHGVPVSQEGGDTAIYSIAIDDMFIGHLGSLRRPLTESELELLGKVDVLLLPVGGYTTLDAKKAVEVLAEIEPRIIIPMQYKIPGLKGEYGSLDLFLNEYGTKDVETVDKLKITKKDMPADETKVIVLTQS